MLRRPRRYEGLGLLALIIMPVLIINVLITMNLAGGFDHWDDQFPAGLSVLAQPDSVVLGVRNATGPFRFLVKNKHHLPLVGAKVVLQVGPSRSTAPARPPSTRSASPPALLAFPAS